MDERQLKTPAGRSSATIIFSFALFVFFVTGTFFLSCYALTGRSLGKDHNLGLG
jgi:hypothetical protein